MLKERIKKERDPETAENLKMMLTKMVKKKSGFFVLHWGQLIPIIVHLTGVFGENKRRSKEKTRIDSTEKEAGSWTSETREKALLPQEM